MIDKLFTKRLRDLTDEAIRESLAEISVEFEKRFGPAALTASPPVVERGAIKELWDEHIRLVGMDDGYAMALGKDKFFDAILALTPVEGVGEHRCAVCNTKHGHAPTCPLSSAFDGEQPTLSTPVAQGDEVRDALEGLPENWYFWLRDSEQILQSNGTETHAEKIQQVRSALATLTKGARDAG